MRRGNIWPLKAAMKYTCQTHPNCILKWDLEQLSIRLSPSLLWAWYLSAFEIFIQWLLEFAFFEPHCMLANAFNTDLTFYYQLSVTVLTYYLVPMQFKAFSKERGQEKSRNKSRTKMCQQKTSLETYYIETGICSMAWRPRTLWHSLLIKKPYFT